VSYAGQRLRLKILLLAESTEDQGELDRLLEDDSSRTCSTVLVVGEPVLRRSRELAVCVGRSRVRPLYTSTAHTVTVYVTAAGFHSGDFVVRPRFLVIFEGWLVGWLKFNVPFQHKYGYIRDERSGMESYPLTQ